MKSTYKDIMDKLREVNGDDCAGVIDSQQIETLSGLFKEARKVLEVAGEFSNLLDKTESVIAIEVLRAEVAESDEFIAALWSFLVRHHGWNPDELREALLAFIQETGGLATTGMLPQAAIPFYEKEVGSHG